MSDFCPRDHLTEPGKWYLVKDDFWAEYTKSDQIPDDWTLQYGYIIKHPREARNCNVHQMMNYYYGTVLIKRHENILRENVGRVCQCGAYPIELAMRYRLNVVPFLLELGADRSKVKFTTADLRYAWNNLRYGWDDLNLLRLMLKDETIDVNTQLGTWGYPIQHAGTVECLQILVEHGAEINPEIGDDIQHPSTLAACLDYNRTSEIEYLIKHGANMETEEIATYLARATLCNLKIMVDNGFQLKNKQLLHRMVRVYDDNKFRYLLEQGLDVNERNAIGATVFHILAWGNNQTKQTIAIRLLLDYGADIDVQDNEGKTPLHWACTPVENKHKVRMGSIKNLLEAGADSRITDHDGRTAFSYLPKKMKPKFVGIATKRA